ncbi:hypothetical protein OG896_33825 [Streptomyces sp. NBC_00669]|uniref:hypothetical protein n=1 Tax=unclassified Streptomyces TaxID=2593676 RepID=UPI002E1D8890|nr:MULTISPECIES: hypothetical protein [unclassified Streptomyces]
MNKSGSRNRGGKNTRRGNPKMVFLMSLVLALGSLGALIFVPKVAAEAVGKSGYTQAHGLARSGIVTRVTNHHGKVPFADIEVRLGEPVDGQATTTVHDPSLTSLKPGAAVRVLVDPKGPGYAEFPGRRFNGNSTSQQDAVRLLLLVCCAAFAFTAAWWGREWYRDHKHRQTAEFQGATGATQG